VVFGWRALCPSRVVFVIGCESCNEFSHFRQKRKVSFRTSSLVHLRFGNFGVTITNATSRRVADWSWEYSCGAQEHPGPVRAPDARPPSPVHATGDVPMQACLPDPARARSAKSSICSALSLRMLPIELIQVRDGAHSLVSIMLRVRHLWRLD